MNIAILYLITFITAILLVGGYSFVRVGLKKKDKYETIKKWYVLGSIIFFISMFVVSYYCQDNAMISHMKGHDSAYLEGGLVALVGVPYGDNKAANFFALFQVILLYPSVLALCLIPFYPFKTGKRIAKYFIPVIAFVQSAFLFNHLNAIYGSIAINFKQILSSLQMGAFLGSSVIYSWSIFKDEDISFKNEQNKKLSIAHLVIFTFVLHLFVTPIYTMAALIPNDFKFFGRAIMNWHVLDFSLVHRIALYLTLGVPVIIYFLFRNKEKSAREFAILFVTLGALILFSSTENLEGMFPMGGDGIRHVSAKDLPIHLCHTALYVTPFCIITKNKRLFYFTYFINVFGALMAMLMPNYNEYYSVLHPTISHFWANHMIAFYSPLLCVALRLFEKPKFKQMLWSLLFFLAYFVLIVFANAWLSNYVSGFNPNKIGTGTDYLFINGDFILGKLGDDSKVLLNTKLVWTWGSCTFVIYPLYQVLFYLGYVAIAFAMWFLYSLFFRIADAHNDLRVKLYIARKEKISFKQKQKLLEGRNMDLKETEAKLELIHFSKRYGNSDVLSADDVNLTVNAGEIFGYLGPNGAGKSTCIKTIIGIQPVTDGEIKVCGFDVTEEPVITKRLIGYVPDHYALYEKLTGREYINYIADLYGVSKEDRDMRIAKYVDLFELTQAFDNRMQTYSHGMKQKMTIMAALV
ncbi:MAG: YwaF family protein, partial [Bacilli bacterium]|nr:YwaF family protein [Bacilli bacterium]